MTSQGEIKARVGWLWFGIGVTLLYVGALYLLLPSPKTCDQAAGLVRYFDCYDLNAVGDFLAGVFAPIAFLWLVVAVLIQSQELSLQRQELAATRAEVTENRKVAQAQADEARRQAEFIGKQTQILEAERQRAEMAGVDAEIAALIAGLVDTLRITFRSLVTVVKADRSKHGFMAATLSADREPILALTDFARWFDAVSRHILTLNVDNAFVTAEGLNVKAIEDTLNRLAHIDELARGASAEWRVKLGDAHVTSLLEQLAGVTAAMNANNH